MKALKARARLAQTAGPGGRLLHAHHVGLAVEDAQIDGQAPARRPPRRWPSRWVSRPSSWCLSSCRGAGARLARAGARPARSASLAPGRRGTGRPRPGAPAWPASRVALGVARRRTAAAASVTAGQAACRLGSELEEALSSGPRSGLEVLARQDPDRNMCFRRRRARRKPRKASTSGLARTSTTVPSAGRLGGHAEADGVGHGGALGEGELQVALAHHPGEPRTCEPGTATSGSRFELPKGARRPSSSAWPRSSSPRSAVASATASSSGAGGRWRGPAPAATKASRNAAKPAPSARSCRRRAAWPP